jgi:predicted 3-demethylubiquinone-9 3-methyltransferase (glyoxalase superfamily)
MPFPKGIDGSVKLAAGGEKGRCGWLKDKFGQSWQIVPAIVGEMMQDQDVAFSQTGGLL